MQKMLIRVMNNSYLCVHNVYKSSGEGLKIYSLFKMLILPNIFKIKSIKCRKKTYGKMQKM